MVDSKGTKDAISGLPLTRMKRMSGSSVAASSARSSIGLQTDPLLVAYGVTGVGEDGMDCLTTRVVVQRTPGNPEQARVSIAFAGCHDDIVDAQVTNVLMVRTGGTGPWSIREVREAWKCGRGAVKGRWSTSDCGGN